LGRSGTTQHKSGPPDWPVGAGYDNVDGLVLTPGRRDGCAPRQPSDFLQRSGSSRLFFYSRPCSILNAVPHRNVSLVFPEPPRLRDGVQK